MDEEEFERVIFKLWEQDLNANYAVFRKAAEVLVQSGVTVPAVVASLIHAGRELAKDNPDAVGEAFFERCVEDILNGGDGLRVNADRKDRR